MEEKQLKQSECINVGPWQILVKVTNVLCSDGKQRNARITGQADSYFTVPASVSVKGKTVSGFVTTSDYELAEKHVFRFHAYQNKKNGYLLP